MGIFYSGLCSMWFPFQIFKLEHPFKKIKWKEKYQENNLLRVVF
jgi:hypothetical protein